MKTQLKKSKKNIAPKKESAWARDVRKLREDVIRTMKRKGIPQKSEEEIIKECRKIRELVWKEEFAYKYPD